MPHFFGIEFVFHIALNQFMQQTALFVLDIQERLLKALPDADSLLQRCAFAIKSAHLLSIPVVFFEQCPEKLGSTHRELLCLREPADLYFSKHTFSALELPEVSDWIRQSNTKHLLLQGIETGICVYQTALSCLRCHLQATILSDCIQARRPSDATHALDQLKHLGCTVLPSETIFYSLIGTTEHPAFKTFTELVKHTP